jgi:hypothetical protein
VGLGWLVNAYSRHFVDGGRDGPVQADKAKEVGPQSHMGGEGGWLWVQRGGYPNARERFYNETKWDHGGGHVDFDIIWV